MLKSLRTKIIDWLIQWYIKNMVLPTHNSSSQVLFDYKNGLWETLVSGSCNDSNNGVVQLWVNQVIDHRYDATLIWMLHSTEGGGFVVAIRPNKQHYEKFFLSGLYEMPDAIKAVTKWCENGNNIQSKGDLNGQSNSQQTTNEKEARQ